jgi:hypothetical protein
VGENQLQDAPEAKPHRRADIQGLRAVAVAMVVAYHAGLPLLDPNDLLCEDGRCSTSRGGQRLYRDAKHVSIDGALLFTPRFTEIIEERAVPRDEAS